MHLKALELLGFKSFPDYTLLHFDADITAVVGPNGSGKSNISDAIRWVMGEQSSKALRGGKMEDVIFGGTQVRRGLGFAEVSLTLDNEDGSLALESLEVCVTRRYYRSGDSEYYINRKICRLRDINELFMDTGLGQEGYSLIGQGKIDEILSVKSTQRRAVFEEAAGISRYRHRKEEAERKLIHTRENLLRISDKIEELSLQLAPLEKQAEKARRFFACREELRRLDVSLWMERLSALRSMQESVQRDYDETMQTLGQAEAESERLYAKAEALQYAAQEKDLQIDERRRVVSRLEEAGAVCTQRISVLQVQEENNRAGLLRLASEAQTQRSRQEALEQQVKTRQEEHARLAQEGEASNAALLQMDAALVQLRQSVQACEAAHAALASKQEREGQSTQRVRSLVSALDATQQELSAREEALTREQAQLMEQHTQLRQEIEAAAAIHQQLQKQRAAQQAATQGAQQQAEVCVSFAQSKQEAWVSLRMEENALAARITMLADMERHYEGYSKAVKTVMERAASGQIRGVHGPLAALIEVPERFALAVETALGGALQNLVVETQQVGRTVLEDLKRRDGGRVTCLPLDAVEGSRLDTRQFASSPGYLGLAVEQLRFDARYEKIIAQLLGKVVLVDTLENGIAMSRAGRNRLRIVTLDGQVLSPGGAMTGGSSNRRGGILTRASELSGLQEKQSELKSRREQAEGEAAAAKLEQQAAQQAFQSLQNELASFDSRLAGVAAEAKNRAAQREELARREAHLDSEAAGLAQRRALSAQQRGEAQEKIAQIEVAGTRLQGERARLEEELQAKRTEREAMQEARREQELRLAVQAAEMRAAQAAVTQLHAQMAYAKQEGVQRAQEQARIEAESVTLQAEMAQQDTQWKQLQDEKRVAQGQLEQRSSEKLAIEAERAQTDRESRTQNDVLLHAQRGAVLLEQKKLAGEAEQTQLLDKLWEQYELSHEAARALAQPLEDKKEAERRATQLRGEMRALGQVNLGAIEEYERVRERFDYLDGQKRDVEDADKQLVGIITALAEQMQEIFKREFDRINEAFVESFRSLFGGGTAQLLLEDARDVLNCGIEIRVQPPGKTLKTLSLLSGGEKAFVAIALYFSILKIRPTPFCVLDEIEAALDDANVTRFATHLRAMAKRTQFIVITHRRGTMEEADLLYGVTMEQQGVSRMLRLNLNEAEASLQGTQTAKKIEV